MYDGGRYEAQSWQENYFVSLTSLCRYKRHFAVINFTLVKLVHRKNIRQV